MVHPLSYTWTGSTVNSPQIGNNKLLFLVGVTIKAKLSFEGFYVVVAHAMEPADLLLCGLRSVHTHPDKPGVTDNLWLFPQRVACTPKDNILVGRAASGNSNCVSYQIGTLSRNWLETIIS